MRTGLCWEEEVGQTVQACLGPELPLLSQAESGQGRKVGRVYFVKTMR